jgi:ergothioneine biosynthesis protein EgtC
MCRFLVYKGPEMFMSDLLTRSEQSLIRQSFKAREREEPLNGDGFGVGWYSPEIDPAPCVFNSIRPAWSDRNLRRLAEKIRSTCFFAHVRAATTGIVSELNCHPFQYGRLLWMHNGQIADFAAVRRRLRESLDDAAYDAIQGTTDSEHAFAAFLNRILPVIDGYTADDLVAAMRDTLAALDRLCGPAAMAEPSRYNFALTDGEIVLASRYVSDPAARSHSLYVCAGERFENVNGHYRMLPADGRPGAVIIASEPLTDDRTGWNEVPSNTLVLVTAEHDIRYIPVT